MFCCRNSTLLLGVYRISVIRIRLELDLARFTSLSLARIVAGAGLGRKLLHLHNCWLPAVWAKWHSTNFRVYWWGNTNEHFICWHNISYASSFFHCERQCIKPSGQHYIIFTAAVHKSPRSYQNSKCDQNFCRRQICQMLSDVGPTIPQPRLAFSECVTECVSDGYDELLIVFGLISQIPGLHYFFLFQFFLSFQLSLFPSVSVFLY